MVFSTISSGNVQSLSGFSFSQSRANCLSKDGCQQSHGVGREDNRLRLERHDAHGRGDKRYGMLQRILQQRTGRRCSVVTKKSFSVCKKPTLRASMTIGICSKICSIKISFGSMSHFRPLSYFCKFLVWIIRGTPLMIQLLIIYYFPGLVL